MSFSTAINIKDSSNITINGKFKTCLRSQEIAHTCNVLQVHIYVIS